MSRAASHGRAFAILFIAAAALFASIYVSGEQNSALIVVAAMLGGYMALNIGANDVANNVGPAVGSKALSMLGALVIAAVFESAGALIAGGDVVGTISKGIIDPATVADTGSFHLGDDGRADIVRALGQPGDSARRAGLDHPFRRRRRHGRRHRGSRLFCRQLADHGRDRGQLGHFPGTWRRDRRGVPRLHQDQHHLP
jgi:hypothetical protein